MQDSTRVEEEQLRSLMSAYQSGESSAFEILYTLLEPKILKYLYWKTLNRETAQELLQETFLQIHRSRRTYIPPRPVLPWVFGIARNVYLMDRRVRNTEKSWEVDSEFPEPDLDSLSEFQRIADRDLIRKALALVSPKRKEVVLMHHILGLSFKEIAGVLGIRPVTAKVRAHRGIKDLRDSVSKLNVTRESQPAKQ
jgi:RNA polymerase sigma-70 factor (ECF subfamily)